MDHITIFRLFRWLIMAIALAPFVYYLLSIYCVYLFFSARPKENAAAIPFTPPISILKPVRGLDREAYENYSSYCCQDYPLYEILFAVSDADDPAISVIERLIRDFPERSIRLLIGAPQLGASSKVCKLCRLVHEASYDLLVISDSDVRVETDYLRRVAEPFRDPQVGAVTALFRGRVNGDFASQLDCVGSSAEFCSSALVARKLEGLKFTLGATMATTRERLAEIGGFEALANHHSDDFELGNRIASKGYRIELLDKPVWMIFPAQSFGTFLRHELRWAIGLRNIRPLGHLGLVFTHGIFWALLAAALAHSSSIAGLYLGGYVVLRFAMAWTAGVWGLKDPVIRKRIYLVPVRDALAFLVWLVSFMSNRIQWRGLDFTIEKGILVPVPSPRDLTAADEYPIPE
ncbi:MAG TPA: bacteriohopanetetrol glucosamine biosynthesis glycosyltransferase HpnI [Candidatus Dormibacteraeota bacterium]|nr:bacteriohopanetetrol glucosamine biosynthesis glycosyltransferase HpnI [Candidatus Dormibacteraeota bacterium]